MEDRLSMEIIEYTEEFGPVCYPEGFEACLDGLTIEEQLNYFRLGNGLYLQKGFSERRKNCYDAADRLDQISDVKAIVVKYGKIAGVKVYDKEIGKDVICKPECRYCIRHDRELDGSGYKTFTLYQYLLCVSEQFELEE